MTMPDYLRNLEKHIVYLTNTIIGDLKLKKIRAVEALWKKEVHTVSLSFYLDGELTKDEQENTEIACVEIIVQCGDALLEENFIPWNYPKLLPNKNFAYKRKEN